MHPQRGPPPGGAGGGRHAATTLGGHHHHHHHHAAGAPAHHHRAHGSPAGGTAAGGLVTSYDGKIAGLYDLEETLGRGHFAVVKLARHVFTGEKVAVKVIDKCKLDEVSRAHLFQEVRCMKLVQHPNVVRLYEVIDTQTKLYLVLELADGGDLYDLIMRHDGGLPDNVAREHFRQIVRAISYCHQLHVVHRDLKPENVVFFEKLGVVKLTDFGFSNRFCPGQKLETSCGSLAYSAPEILLGDSYDAPAVDVWSLGVILYMLVCGTAPFQEANDSETLTMIMDCKFTVPNHVSEPCKRLIQRMLIREPERRATLEEIASDPWLCEGEADSGGGGGGAADFLPLISREHVSEEDHALIIQKMVNGKIASKEEILEALDKNEYNHVTATYFLLAERKLRAHRLEQQRLLLQGPQGKRTPSQGQPLGPNRLHHQHQPQHPTRRPVSVGYAGSQQAGSNTPRVTPRLCTSPNFPPLIVTGKNYGTEGLDSSLIENKAEDDNTTLKVSQTHLSVPRTPLDVPQSYRARKCSIVQEEEDEDDIAGPGVRDERGGHAGGGGACGGGGGSLNRRGSRSEGRLNVALQERLAAAAGKSDAAPATKPPPATRRPEAVAAPPAPRPRPPPPATAPTAVAPPPPPPPARFRSIPSPNVRPLVLHAVCSSPQLTLNEIFEEGSEPGAASGGHRPPPPVQQRRGYRQGGHGGPSATEGADPAAAGGQEGTRGFERRQKMHKARTASCSSSDASDEDSESRKKRAHKLKTLPPKRDSHDDSSDSQDPGGGGGGAGGGSGAGGGGGGGDGGDRGSERDGPGQGGPGPGRHESCGGGGASSGGRRHAAGGSGDGGHHRHPFRRRSAGGGETRLRESQSLNRITEVQEGGESVTPPPVPRRLPPAPAQEEGTDSGGGRSRAGIGVRLFGGWRRPQSSGAAIASGACTDASEGHTPTGDGCPGEAIAGDGGRGGRGPEGSGEEAKETRRVRGGAWEHGGKARLARYFRLHRKLWLPGLLRGRLYKAQSCGSIRDRVRSAPAVASAAEKQCRAANGTAKKKVDAPLVLGCSPTDINRNVGGKGGRGGLVVALPCPCHGLDSSECCSLC